MSMFVPVRAGHLAGDHRHDRHRVYDPANEIVRKDIKPVDAAASLQGDVFGRLPAASSSTWASSA